MGLIWESSPAAFVVLTCILGGGAAWMTGRALARGWRPASRVVLYMALLALAVRFFHFALAGGTLLSPRYYLVDAAVLIAIGLGSFRVMRTTQMVTQYPWLYRRRGPFGWTSQQQG
jgi:hypothetical protein